MERILCTGHAFCPTPVEKAEIVPKESKGAKRGLQFSPVGHLPFLHNAKEQNVAEGCSPASSSVCGHGTPSSLRVSEDHQHLIVQPACQSVFAFGCEQDKPRSSVSDVISPAQLIYSEKSSPQFLGKSCNATTVKNWKWREAADRATAAYDHVLLHTNPLHASMPDYTSLYVNEVARASEDDYADQAATASQWIERCLLLEGRLDQLENEQRLLLQEHESLLQHVQGPCSTPHQPPSYAYLAERVHHIMDACQPQHAVIAQRKFMVSKNHETENRMGRELQHSHPCTSNQVRSEGTSCGQGLGLSMVDNSHPKAAEEQEASNNFVEALGFMPKEARDMDTECKMDAVTGKPCGSNATACNVTLRDDPFDPLEHTLSTAMPRLGGSVILPSSTGRMLSSSLKNMDVCQDLITEAAATLKKSMLGSEFTELDLVCSMLIAALALLQGAGAKHAGSRVSSSAVHMSGCGELMWHDLQRHSQKVIQTRDSETQSDQSLCGMSSWSYNKTNNCIDPEADVEEAKNQSDLGCIRDIAEEYELLKKECSSLHGALRAMCHIEEEKDHLKCECDSLKAELLNSRAENKRILAKLRISVMMGHCTSSHG